MEQIGRKLASARAAAGLSQEQLAEKLYVSRDLVAKWETGARRIAYRYVRSIADLFGSDPDEWMPKDEILFAELSECVPEGLDVSPSELEEELNGFLRTMDAESCDLFLQRYYYMEDYAAIAGKKSQKENRVRAKVSRIRKKLKRYLKEEMT